jgi:hypothetical protein
MPRYYFNISLDNGSGLPDDGIDLPDKEAAWTEATAACGEIIRDMDGSLKPGDSWRMVVKDEQHLELFQLEFSTRASG